MQSYGGREPSFPKGAYMSNQTYPNDGNQGQQWQQAPQQPMPPQGQQPMPPYGQQPIPPQGNPQYTPVQNGPSNAPFVLSIVGLVLTIIALAVPGLILSIIALVKNGGQVKKGLGGDRAKSTKALGIVGVVLATIVIIVQVGAIALGVFAAMTEIENGDADYAVYELEEEVGQDLNNDGYIGDPYFGQDASNGYNEQTPQLEVPESDPGNGSNVPEGDVLEPAAGNMIIGSYESGYVEIPENWVMFQDVTLEENSGIIAYSDPNSSYDSQYYGGQEYGTIVTMTGLTGDAEDNARRMLDYNNSSGDYINATMEEYDIGTLDGYMLTSYFEADKKVVKEYFIESNDETRCAYICIEYLEADAANVPAIIDTFRFGNAQG